MTFITKAAAVLLGSGLGLFVPCAWAQQAAPTAATAAPISLQAALALAMEHNPGLRAAAQALAASEGALIQSRARPNPELAYSQEDTRRETRSMTLQWNQSIEIGGKRAARMKAAGHGRELARAELEAAQAGLRADVRTAFAN
ncbi:TolC family protein, partial [Comamonas thiooxydans]